MDANPRTAKPSFWRLLNPLNWGKQSVAVEAPIPVEASIPVVHAPLEAPGLAHISAPALAELDAHPIRDAIARLEHRILHTHDIVPGVDLEWGFHLSKDGQRLGHEQIAALEAAVSEHPAFWTLTQASEEYAHPHYLRLITDRMSALEVADGMAQMQETIAKWAKEHGCELRRTQEKGLLHSIYKEGISSSYGLGDMNDRSVLVQDLDKKLVDGKTANIIRGVQASEMETARWSYNPSHVHSSHSPLVYLGNDHEPATIAKDVAKAGSFTGDHDHIPGNIRTHERVSHDPHAEVLKRMAGIDHGLTYPVYDADSAVTLVQIDSGKKIPNVPSVYEHMLKEGIVAEEHMPHIEAVALGANIPHGQVGQAIEVVQPPVLEAHTQPPLLFSEHTPPSLSPVLETFEPPAPLALPQPFVMPTEISATPQTLQAIHDSWEKPPAPLALMDSGVVPPAGELVVMPPEPSFVPSPPIAKPAKPVLEAVMAEALPAHSAVPLGKAEEAGIEQGLKEIEKMGHGSKLAIGLAAGLALGVGAYAWLRPKKEEVREPVAQRQTQAESAVALGAGNGRADGRQWTDVTAAAQGPCVRG